MSRIGNRPIDVDPSINVELNGKNIKVTGKNGTLEHIIPKEINVSIEKNQLTLVITEPGRRARSMHGLTRTLVANMVHGVSKGFEKGLEIHGVGYRAQIQGKSLIINLGYSHPVEYPIPEDIDIAVAENTKITIKGADKQQVGQVAAVIRQFRKPEPYKGKGIRYVGEYILMKEGKTV